MWIFWWGNWGSIEFPRVGSHDGTDRGCCCQEVRGSGQDFRGEGNEMGATSGRDADLRQHSGPFTPSSSGPSSSQQAGAWGFVLQNLTEAPVSFLMRCMSCQLLHRRCTPTPTPGIRINLCCQWGSASFCFPPERWGSRWIGYFWSLFLIGYTHLPICLCIDLST